MFYYLHYFIRGGYTSTWWCTNFSTNLDRGNLRISLSFDWGHFAGNFVYYIIFYNKIFYMIFNNKFCTSSQNTIFGEIFKGERNIFKSWFFFFLYWCVFNNNVRWILFEIWEFYIFFTTKLQKCTFRKKY